MNIHRSDQAAAGHIPRRGGSERRSTCRYSPVQASTWLGWWEGQKFHSTAAKIVDISLGGTRLYVDAFPAPGRPVWLRPPGVASHDAWIEANLMGMRKKLLGPRELRLAFRKVFPYGVFRAVVYGPDHFNNVTSAKWVPESGEEGDWW